MGQTVRVRLIQGEQLVIPNSEIRDGRRVLDRTGVAEVADGSWVRRTIARGDLEIVPEPKTPKRTPADPGKE